MEPADLVWLLYHGLVVHLKPWQNPQTKTVTFVPAHSLDFDKESHFALTATGEKFFDQFFEYLWSTPEKKGRAWNMFKLGRLAPRYEPKDRILVWGCYLVKHFRQPSKNQELILASAEELGWPKWFDDPLPPRPGVNPKIRLHDTIKDLNRRQISPIVHFQGDGTGQKAGWKLR